MVKISDDDLAVMVNPMFFILERTRKIEFNGHNNTPLVNKICRFEAILVLNFKKILKNQNFNMP
jgi:hypothetical protein